LGWTIGVLGFDYRRGLGIFLFTTAFRTALVPIQPPIQWVPGALYLGVRRPGREAHQSPPSSAEVKEFVELYLHFPNTPSWRGAQLKHRDNFTFSFCHNFQRIHQSLRSCVTFRKKLFFFYGEELLAPPSTPKQKDHNWSAVLDCSFNIFAATLHIW
jgi:hypothetical protein